MVERVSPHVNRRSPSPAGLCGVVAMLATISAAPAWAGDGVEANRAATGSRMADAEPISAERLALARRLFDDMRLETTLRGVFASMFESMPRMMAGPNAATNDKARDLMASMSAGMDAILPEMIDAEVKIYARNFTARELTDAATFYESPSGQAMITKLPTVMNQAMPAVMQLVPRLYTAAETDYCARRGCTETEKAQFQKVQSALEGRLSPKTSPTP